MLELPPGLLSRLSGSFPGRDMVCHATVKLVLAAPVPTEWTDTGIVGELVVLHDRALDTVYFQVRFTSLHACTSAARAIL